MGGGKCFFLRFSTDAIVLLAHWVREGVYCYAVGTTPSGTGAAFYPWKSFPSCCRSTAQCSFGSQSPQENLRSLTRPDVEVKFSSIMT